MEEAQGGMMVTAQTHFHRFVTRYEQLPRDDRGRYPVFGEFYRAIIQEALTDGTYCDVEAEAVTEHNWLALRKPYYKIWPGYVAMLGRTRLNLPVEVFHVPHESFGIFLPKGMPSLRFANKGREFELQSMLVSAGVIPDGTRILSLVINDGEESYTRTTLRLTANTTLEECHDDIDEWDGIVSRDMTMAALRLAVAVSLLAVSVHRYVEHDVIASLRERYDRAHSTAERERLAATSQRRGVNGWRIGRGRCLALTTGLDGDTGASGRHLSFQHVRGGHFHTVCHGPRRQLRKVVFFEPTIVRPDLPPPPVLVESGTA